jgi:L-threonylcarbamoyladenylate synthase
MPIRPASPDTIAEAASLLRAGRLVAFPTETVYGLGADATCGSAVAAIYAAKGRPQFNPLIVHVAGRAAAEAFAELDGLASRLAEAFWPGPLTLVLPQRRPSPIATLATAGLDTVAVRVPSHPVALALIAAAEVPVAAPSANRSGHVSPTTAEHVAADLGDRVPLILDGGPTTLGLESTVVAVTGGEPILLRPGAVTAEDIERIAARPLRRRLDAGAQPISPGQIASHYAPRARVRLDATRTAKGEALLAFGALGFTHNGPVINLSPTGDLTEAAVNLFGALRTLDASGAATIAVMAIPADGLGEAINDRLRRAAADR